MTQRNSRPSVLGFKELLVLAVLFASFSTFEHSHGQSAEAEGKDAPIFERDVLPILEQNCLKCHGEKVRKGDLDQRRVSLLLKGGERGPALVKGSAEDSLLFQLISEGSMPPNKEPKLSEAEIDLIRRWIDSGALADGKTEDHPGDVAQVTEREVLETILRVKCIVCHGKRIQEAGFSLRTREDLLTGGESGPAVVPGKPDESLLLKRIDNGHPTNELQNEYFVRAITSEEIEKLRQWIVSGAPPMPSEVVAREWDETLAMGRGEDSLVSEEDRKFWSFQPPQRPPAPEVDHKESVRTPIDAFLLKKMEAKGLKFSPEAERVVLMRRAYLDLTGLPPEPREVEAYLKDDSSDAYEQLIDRLLASPHYGERWGQHWLDAAGYADSEGGVGGDHPREHAYRYRDYVIRSLNADKPYDQFLLEQMAGDELFDYKVLENPTSDQIDSLVATGFLRMTPDSTYSHDVNFIPDRLNVVADMVEMFSSSVMGMTMACARCHNHKFDPIPQRDYYRFSAIFRTAYDPYDWLLPKALGGGFQKRQPPQRFLSIEGWKVEEKNAPVQEEIQALEKDLEKKAGPLREHLFEEKLAQLPEAVREDLRKASETPEENRGALEKYLVERFMPSLLHAEIEELKERSEDFRQEADKLQAAIEEAKKKLEPEPKIRALYDMGGEPTSTYVLKRGEPFKLGAMVLPGVPSVLSERITPYEVNKPPWTTDTSGRRLALARWLTQDNHPLTGRVMINRIWQHHFQKGLVATPGNFGHTGLRPSHPQLLDWMTTEFVRQGWSIKAMHKLIMTSAAYRQSSQIDQSSMEADPDNELLSRFPLRRMDAETIRDSMLKVAGRLDSQLFGPPDDVVVKADGEVEESRPPGKSSRRSIYVQHRRSTPLTLLEAFDFPRVVPNCLMRRESNVSTQALQLMNDDRIRETSRFFAGRVMDAVGSIVENQVDRVYLAALSRPPAPEEKKLGVEAIEDFTQHWLKEIEKEVPPEPMQSKARWLALASLCHTVLNSPDFIYID